MRRTIKREKRIRRTDLLIALGVSAAAHVAIAMMPGETKARTQPPEVVAQREIQAIELPLLDETPVEVNESEAAETPVAEFAPPSQADYPSVVTIDSFVQVMQPPTPSGLSTDVSMLVVPPTSVVSAGGGAPKLFDIADLDRVPRRIRTGPLEYPPEFRRSRTEGRVVLAVIIDPTGRVTVDKVLESTHPEFSRAATKAAEQCRYEPPIKGGVAVSARYTWPIAFALDSD